MNIDSLFKRDLNKKERLEELIQNHDTPLHSPSEWSSKGMIEEFDRQSWHEVPPSDFQVMILIPSSRPFFLFQNL